MQNPQFPEGARELLFSSRAANHHWNKCYYRSWFRWHVGKYPL